MTLICSRCSCVNPKEAVYCYFDGHLLTGQGGVNGTVQAGQKPFPHPFVFPSGQSCQNLDQLALACQKNWSEAQDLLDKGMLGQFLANIGRADLAEVAREAHRAPDRNRGLDEFLSKLPAKSLADPKLKVQPPSLNLGTLPLGSNRTLEMEIRNEGNRLLYGTAVSEVPWLVFGALPGQSEKLFQCLDATKLVVQVRGDRLRAGDKPREGKLHFESNGGTLAVSVTVQVPAKPFPTGVLKDARTPREIAVKAKESPKDAAVLFQQGAVAHWYKENGWDYPVRGKPASGVAAVQQFFEALGLVVPPRVKVSIAGLNLIASPGEPIEDSFHVYTDEKKHLYAHAHSNQPWMTVETKMLNPTRAQVHVVATVPPSVSGVLQGHISLAANGNQRVNLPVNITVPDGLGGVADAPVLGTPVGGVSDAPNLITGTPVSSTSISDAPGSPFPPPPPPPMNDFSELTTHSVGAAGSDSLISRPSSYRRRNHPVWVHLLPVGILVLALVGLFVRDLTLGNQPGEGPSTTAKVEEGNNSSGGDIGKRVGWNVPIDPLPRLFYRYGPKKQFGMFIPGTTKRITFENDGESNSTVLLVNKAPIEFGGEFGKWVHQEKEPSVNEDGEMEQTHTKNVWHSDYGIRVTQVVELVPSSLPEGEEKGAQHKLDTCLVAYLIENKAAKAHKVGLRVQLDTFIGTNDGVPFTIAGQKNLVTTQADFHRDKQNIPAFIQALEKPDLQNPGTVAHLSLKIPNLEPPGRVSLTNWPGRNDANHFRVWDVKMRDMEEDSVVVLYWLPELLKPGESRALGFSYGLGKVSTTNLKGKTQLGLTLSGSFIPGETFTATAYVTNPRKKQKLTLKLPKGLELTKGKRQQPVPYGLGKKETRLVTWTIRVEKAGRFPIEVVSSTGGSQQRILTITQSEPEKYPTQPKNLFR